MSWSTAISDSAAFSAMLRVDPAVALVPPVVEPVIPGPAHQAQYVVELVGPRSVPAGSVAHLLGAQWYGALGQPEMFVMGPADQQWQQLTAQTSGSYDSIAVCWDILRSHASLSRASAQHLYQLLEEFARSIGRKAIPIPGPDDMDRVALALKQAKSELDIGVSLTAFPAGPSVLEEDLWIQCARLGLQFSPEGSFDWTSPNHPSPLFSVTPIGSVDRFSLAAVQSGARHEGVTIGFNLPRCPAPMAAFDGALHAADVIALTIGGAPFDDSARPLMPDIRDELRASLRQGVTMLEQAGLKPGSASALRIFG